jgi:hypothetical protein
MSIGARLAPPPFRIYSGSISEGEEARLLSLGVTHIVRKPAPPILLRNMIVNILARPAHFEFVAATGSQVFVAGTFNDWDPRRHPMHDDPDEGFFTTTLVLPRGRYEYKFLVDGNWCPDPKCATSVSNGCGSLNSVIHV